MCHIEARYTDPNPALCLVNASVWTGKVDRPRVGALAVVGSRIAALGSEAEARAAAGADARIVDCRRGTVLPGLIDAHVHFLALARSLATVDCSPRRIRSIGELCARLRAAADEMASGSWVRGHGYDEYYLDERRHPTAKDLDAVISDHPIRLRHRSRHATVVNSLAMRRLSELAPGLLAASGVERDPISKEPTGVLYDLDEAVTAIMPPCTEAELWASMDRASRELLAAGVTAVDDASPNNGPKETRLVREATAAGVVRQRVRLLWGMESHGLPEDPSITGVKLVLGEGGGPQPRVARAVALAHDRGLQVAVHAVEGSAIAVAVDAFEAALRGRPRSHRHRLEHCALCPPALADRIAGLGLAVVVQPGFVQCAGDRYLAEVPPGEQSWLYPLRSLARRGVRLAGSSDAPVGPLAPLAGVAAATGRRTARGQTVAAAERLSLASALDLYGRGAAFVTGRERTHGSLAVGHRADLVVCDQDLTRLPAEHLGSAAVSLVFIDGRCVFPGPPSDRDGAPGGFAARYA